MKTYFRIVRRRVEAAFRLTVRPAPPAAPLEVVMDPPVELPSEIIDLASGPFSARFPDLAARRRGPG